MKRRVMVTLLTCVVLCAAGLALLSAGCHKNASEQHAAKQAKYHCPMHPSYTSDRPGTCPICGMNLVPINEGLAADTTAHAHDSSAVPGQAPVSITPAARQKMPCRSPRPSASSLLPSAKT